MKKKMEGGESKAPAFTRFNAQKKEKSQVLYMQPSLFVEDAQEFLKNQ